MTDISLFEQIHNQQEKNRKAYEAFFGALNLSLSHRYDTLAQENLSPNLLLLNKAGFKPKNLVDRLDAETIKVLRILTEYDHTPLF